MHPLLHAMAVSRKAGVVSLNNQTVYDSDFGPSATIQMGVRLNADGTVDQQVTGVYTQIYTTTDWIIPNSAGAAQYYVRATEVSYVENELNPAVFGTKSGDTVGSWLTLGNGQTREWYLEFSSNSAGQGNATWVIDVEIATDAAGTNVVATARYTLDGDIF